MSDLFHAASQRISELRDFVREEFATQRRKHAEQMALTQPERVEAGTCLDGLHFVRVDAQGRAEFTHAGNDSRLREGDRVTLSRVPAAGEWAVWIFREEGPHLWLAAETPLRAAAFEGNPDGWLIDEAFLDLEQHYLDALDRLPATEIGQTCVLPLLEGRAAASLDDAEYEAALTSLPDHWEDAQQEAIAGCLAADHCYLVQGPPGTGKTRVLAEVVRQLVERGERVLLTAFTHRAIDNALAAVARTVADRPRVARFGAALHRRDESYPLYGTFPDSPLPELDGGWVAGATPFALRKRLPNVTFDTIVIDEAGQMTTPLAIMAMLTGRKYLFFGDQQQLGPVVVSRPRREAESAGIFHTLRAQALHGTRLDVTWRLNDILTAWPSGHFYQGKLTPAPAIAPRRLSWQAAAETPAWTRAALDPDFPLTWICFPHDQCHTVSQAEADTAARLLLALRAGGVRPEDAAVVTPYRRQARAVRRRLEMLDPHTSWRGCLIDTVERMQGQERDVILLTFAASEPYFLHRQAEFLFDPRRLNVAATRARTKLIILAARQLPDMPAADPDLAEDIALLGSLRRAANRISAP